MPVSHSDSESVHAQGEHGLKQCGMGEGLGVVAEVSAGHRIHFFGEEPERAGERGELVEEVMGFAKRPVRARARTSQNEQGRKAPSMPGQAVLTGRVAVDEGPPAPSCCAMASTVPRRRDESVGSKPSPGSRSRAASSSRTIGAGVAAEGSVEASGGDLSGDGVPLDLPSSQLVGPGCDGWRRFRRARSRASQAMSLEWTWWAPSPRISQMPASGSVQRSATWSAKPRHGPPCFRVEVLPGWTSCHGSVEDPPVSVELVLVGCGVADSHRRLCA